ncbi:uncharacterized protein TNCT_116971, partial [Trichonephila clavata]
MEGAGALETNEMLSVTLAEKTKTLNRRRGSYKAKITKLQSFLKDKASNAEQLLLQSKLDKVSEMYSSMEALKIEYYEVVEDEQLPNLEFILEEMEDDLEEIKVGLQTLLLKHDDISKNVSICNTALSNNDFLIVPRITDFVPSIQPNLKIKRFNDINRSILADPSFDKPGKIDMIIGAELFYQILKDGRKVGNHIGMVQGLCSCGKPERNRLNYMLEVDFLVSGENHVFVGCSKIPRSEYGKQ